MKQNTLIVTLPLLQNFGGLLQAFSLKELYREIGVEPRHVNIKQKNITLSKRVLDFFVRNIAYRNGSIFVKKYLGGSKDFESSSDLHKFTSDNCVDNICVGSDQVWRREYQASNFDLYFLSFFSDYLNKISFAASFGSLPHSYSPGEFQGALESLKRFKVVSTRERQSSEYLSKELGVDVTTVNDPTLAFDGGFYQSFFNLCKWNDYSSQVYAYVLDETAHKNLLVEELSSRNKCGFYTCIHGGKISKYLNKRMPSVKQWLESFYNARLVVTDSFHGTVFSILFNKDFYVVLNDARGKDRFTSLLEQFDLQYRIVDSMDDLAQIEGQSIDWDRVNKKRAEIGLESRSFLKRNTVL